MIDADRTEEIRLMSLPGMQKLFRDKMGEIQHGDQWKYPGIDDIFIYFHWQTETPRQYAIRLPFAIDPVNPERGCWFMISRERRNRAGFLNRLSLSNNPTLVILQELCEQEGIDAEEQ